MTRSLALDLIEYIKEENNLYDDCNDEKCFYKRCMYALEDAEYLATLPDKFQDQKIVEDAWEVARCREMCLTPDEFVEDLLPEYLQGYKECFSDWVCFEMVYHINDICNEFDLERVESDAIDKVIDNLIHENAWNLCSEFVKTMKEERGEIYSISTGSSSKDPAIITHYKNGKKFDAVLNKEKIEEIYNCQDYDTIEFDWKESI